MWDTTFSQPHVVLCNVYITEVLIAAGGFMTTLLSTKEYILMDRRLKYWKPKPKFCCGTCTVKCASVDRCKLKKKKKKRYRKLCWAGLQLSFQAFRTLPIFVVFWGCFSSFCLSCMWYSWSKSLLHCLAHHCFNGFCRCKNEGPLSYGPGARKVPTFKPREVRL